MTRTLIAAGVLALFTAACARTVTITPQGSTDPEIRDLSATLTLSDVRRVSNELITEMLTDPRLVARTSGSGVAKTRIAIDPAKVVNRSDSDRVSADDFLNLIEEAMYATDLARVFTIESGQWDYWMAADLTSQAQYGTRGRKQTTYNVRLTLNSRDGERVGIWSEPIILTRD